MEDITFNGKDKAHGIGRLTIGGGSGLIIAIYGPVGGRRNDAHCFNQCNVAARLAEADAAARLHFPHRLMRGQAW